MILVFDCWCLWFDLGFRVWVCFWVLLVSGWVFGVFGWLLFVG